MSTFLNRKLVLCNLSTFAKDGKFISFASKATSMSMAKGLRLVMLQESLQRPLADLIWKLGQTDRTCESARIFCCLLMCHCFSVSLSTCQKHKLHFFEYRFILLLIYLLQINIYMYMFTDLCKNEIYLAVDMS